MNACDMFGIIRHYEMIPSFWEFTGRIKYNFVNDKFRSMEFEIIFEITDNRATIFECIRQGWKFGFKHFLCPKAYHTMWIMEEHFILKPKISETIIDCKGELYAE
jgi:hypothetical protein